MCGLVPTLETLNRGSHQAEVLVYHYDGPEKLWVERKPLPALLREKLVWMAEAMLARMKAGLETGDLPPRSVWVHAIPSVYSHVTPPSVGRR